MKGFQPLKWILRDFAICFAEIRKIWFWGVSKQNVHHIRLQPLAGGFSAKVKQEIWDEILNSVTRA